MSLVYKYGAVGPTDEQRALTTMKNKAIGLKAGKRVKPKSRPQRWADACAEARKALDEAKDKIDAILSPVTDAFGVLIDLQGEYQDWLDGLPENLQYSPVGEKLTVVSDISIPDSIDAENLAEASDALDEAENADLPRGFGND